MRGRYSNSKIYVLVGFITWLIVGFAVPFVDEMQRNIFLESFLVFVGAGSMAYSMMRKAESPREEWDNVVESAAIAIFPLTVFITTEVEVKLLFGSWAKYPLGLYPIFIGVVLAAFFYGVAGWLRIVPREIERH